MCSIPLLQLFLLISLQLILVSCGSAVPVQSRFQMFTIRGKLTCAGEPIGGDVIMVDDNFAFTDHLLTQRKVGHDGKFRLRGEPTDDCLDVLLIVEHRCHNLKFGRHDSKKLKAFSEFRVSLDHLIRSGYDLEMDIELRGNKVTMSSPILTAWKTFLYGKRMMTDLIDRVKVLQFWNKV